MNFIFFISLWILVFTFLAHSEEKQVNFKIIPNLSYSKGENPRQTLDLLIPDPKAVSLKKTLPLVIWIHGGGWRQGNKKSGLHPSRLPEIVKTGKYIGASINYRLSTEEIWPAQIEDCKAAVHWLRTHANKYSIDKNQIAVWGSSAGGHLASMLGTNRPDLKKNYNSEAQNSYEVQAVINFYGPSAFLKMDDFPSNIFHKGPNSPESLLLGKALDKVPELARRASPYHHVKQNLPPFIHFHGTDDPLVPYNQSLILHQKLLSKGNESTLITVKNGRHNMPPNFTVRWVLPFLNYHFYRIGTPLQSQTVVADRKKI